MAEKVDPTWLAYALESPPPPGALDAGVERLRAHYDTLVDYETRARSDLGDDLGVLVLEDTQPRCRWAHFAVDHELAVATAYVPMGWDQLGVPRAAAAATMPLGRAVLAEPERASRVLAAPFVVAVLDRAARRLVIANDCIGAGRLYELSFPGGRVWSNRAAAPILFAGAEPRADARGWRMLAAATWLIGDATLLEGVRKVGAGVVIEADAQGAHERATDAVGELVRPSRLALADVLPGACEEATRVARAAGRAWPGAAEVDLSGGRDSRTVAAAATAARLEVRFNTSDMTPGEADVASELVGALPEPPEHRIRKSGGSPAAQLDRPLLKRALNTQLLHDGLRHPQRVRGRQELPVSRPARATLSGHGGEIAHGFFYRTPSELRRIRWGGRRSARNRLRRMFAKGHSAAREECYEEAEAQVDRVLDDGRRLGVRGPTLLEWFYLMDRFANRSGIAAHSERVSIFGAPAFIRAAFALSPEERIAAALHSEMVARLVPEWADVPYFKGRRQRVREVRRLRLWEAPGDTAAIEAIIAGDGPWTEVYDPGRVRAAWAQARAGEGSGSWESIFEGIAYREAFEEYLAIIRRRSAEGPSLARTG